MTSTLAGDYFEVPVLTSRALQPILDTARISQAFAGQLQPILDTARISQAFATQLQPILDTARISQAFATQLQPILDTARISQAFATQLQPILDTARISHAFASQLQAIADTASQRFANKFESRLSVAVPIPASEKVPGVETSGNARADYIEGVNHHTDPELDIARAFRATGGLSLLFLILLLASTEFGREWLRDYGYLVPWVVLIVADIRRHL